MKNICTILIIFYICVIVKAVTDSNISIPNNSNKIVVSDTNGTSDCQEKIKKLERIIESQRKTIEKQRNELIYLKKLCSDAGIQVTPKEQRKATDSEDQKTDKDYSPNATTKTTKDFDDSDKWKGFRGLEWGVNIKKNVPNMILLEEDKKTGMTLYHRLNDKLSIGKAELSVLSYYFYKDRFCGVYIKTKGYSNFQYLKDASFAYYGEGRQPNEFIEKWIWGGALTGGKDVLVVLEYNEFSEEGTLLMSYRPIYNEMKSDDNTAAKEANKDFK